MVADSIVVDTIEAVTSDPKAGCNGFLPMPPLMYTNYDDCQENHIDDG